MFLGRPPGHLPWAFVLSLSLLLLLLASAVVVTSFLPENINTPVQFRLHASFAKHGSLHLLTVTWPGIPSPAFLLIQTVTHY